MCKMGKLLSKHSSKKPKINSEKSQNRSQNVEQREHYGIEDPDSYHLEEVNSLRKKLKENPEMFILNMLLMSYMFFDDYQTEIRILERTAAERDKRLNSDLIREHQKKVLTPDDILEKVNKRVKFRLSEGANKGELKPLVSQRMFILHENIEIEEKNDTDNYSNVDKPYRAHLEESSNKGFGRLNLSTIPHNHSNETAQRSSSTDSAYSRTSSNLYQSKDECVLENGQEFEDTPSTSTGITRNDSGFSTAVNSESDYEYTRILAAKTPQKLQISEKDIYTNINQLPSKCITHVKVKNQESASESDSEDDAAERGHTRKKHFRKSSLFLTRHYLNSAEFMSHFKKNVFPNYLGQVLGFTDEYIHQATPIPLGGFDCDMRSDTGDTVQWDVMPAISMAWPDKPTFEWAWKNQQSLNKWPRPEMINEIRELKCVVIPRGFMPKKSRNSNMSIEWELGFPNAERYLEYKMSHAQMRLYLYIIILYKKFIEPKTHKHGLLIEHIRILILLECEADYESWPEHRMGTKLKLILKTLNEMLGKEHLPNYFIRGKNVLANVPGMHLRTTKDIIHRILESPLPYFLSALKNVKYVSERLFYPEPNLDELYKILTSDSVFNRDVQLTILAQQKAKIEEEKRRKEDNSRNHRQDKEQQWNRRFLERQRYANAKNMLKNNIGKSKNLTSQRRTSTESIDLNFSIKEDFVNDSARHIKLLTFFIQHFLQIAKKSLKISTTTQTLFYLKQAWYLTKLLEDIDSESALNFQKQIDVEEEKCQKKKVAESKTPVVSKRSSAQFAFTPNKILQVKKKEINIGNLTDSFNSNAVPSQPSSSGLKIKTKLKKNQTDDAANVIMKEVSVEIHNRNKESEPIEIRKTVEVKETTKSVSFRNYDISEEVEEGAEATSL